MLAITVGVLALFVLTLLLQPDKYSLKVSGGLAFSEFSGYDSWRVISVSHNGDKLAVILGNPAMIDAYMAGIPVNGGPFPDGAKMAKIHWNALKAETYPGPPTVPELGSRLCQTPSWRSEENCGPIVLVAIRKALGMRTAMQMSV